MSKFGKIFFGASAVFLMVATTPAVAGSCGLFQVPYRPSSAYDAGGCFIYTFTYRYYVKYAPYSGGVPAGYSRIKYMSAGSPNHCRQLAFNAGKAKALYHSGRYKCWKMYFNGSLSLQK